MSYILRATATLLMLAAIAGPPAVAAESPPVAMKQFVIGLLYKGGAWNSAITDESRKLQSAHRANIDRLVENGSLAVAGPVDSTGDLRGLFIFNVDSVEKAEALIATDPAVSAGQLRFELFVWYGPVAIANVVSQSRQAPAEK